MGLDEGSRLKERPALVELTPDHSDTAQPRGVLESIAVEISLAGIVSPQPGGAEDRRVWLWWDYNTTHTSA